MRQEREEILYATTLSVTLAGQAGETRCVETTVNGDAPTGRHNVELTGPAGFRDLTVDGRSVSLNGAAADAERIEKVEEQRKVTITLRMDGD